MRKFFADKLEVPYRIISGTSLEDAERFEQNTSQLLYAALI